MKDIASDLGISAMAVSKALRDHKDIGEDTKARVLRRAAELGYKIDWVARSMATGRTYLVGLVVPDLMQSFFAEVATSLAAALAPSGYHVLIAHTREDEKDEMEDIDVLVGRKVDGLVIASTQHDARSLSRLKVPFVLIDREIPGLHASFVGPDDHAIGRLATAHLLESGRRRVAHLARSDRSTGQGRRAGYREALGERFDPALVIEAGHDDAGGHRAMRELLARRETVDGVFCYNDPVAIGAMRAIGEAGLGIPGDVAVIGAANIRHGDMLRVPLSTVDQDTAAIGARAGELLLDLIAAPVPPPPRRIETPVALVPRLSTGRAGDR